MGKEAVTKSTVQIVRERLLKKADEYSVYMSPEDALQRAIEEIDAEMEHLGPDTEHPIDTLGVIKHAQQEAGAPVNVDENADNDDYLNAMEYARQCRSAMLKAIGSSVQRRNVFRDEVKRLADLGEIHGEVSDRGWLYEMMLQPDYSDDKEWIRHRNEGIVLTAAAVQGAYVPDFFLARYRKWLAEDKRQNDLTFAPLGRAVDPAKDYDALACEELAAELERSVGIAERDKLFGLLGIRNYMGEDDRGNYLRFLRGELHGDVQKINEVLAPIVRRIALSRLNLQFGTTLGMSELDVNRAKNSAGRIADGNLSQADLDKAYMTVMGNGGLILTQRYEECVRDIEKMGFVYSEDTVADEFLSREQKKNSIAISETKAAQYANPYSALITPEELDNAKIEKFAQDPKGDADYSYLDAYAKDRLRIDECALAIDAANAAAEFIRKYPNAISLPSAEDEDLVMYRFGDKALIFRTEQVLLPGGAIVTRFAEICTDPGLYFDPGMTADLDELLKSGSELPYDSVLDPPPDGGRELVAAIQALRGLKVGKNPTPATTRELSGKLQALRTAAKSFYAKHVGVKDSEKESRLSLQDREMSMKWLDLAVDAITFAEKKLYLLEGIEAHMQRLAEMDMLDEPEVKQPRAQMKEENIIRNGTDDDDDSIEDEADKGSKNLRQDESGSSESEDIKEDERIDYKKLEEENKPDENEKDGEDLDESYMTFSWEEDEKENEQEKEKDKQPEGGKEFVMSPADALRVARELADLTADVKKQQANSEQALLDNKPEDAVKFGTDALVQQTVEALLRSTLGQAGGTAELEKMVRTSKVFQNELEKVDLRRSGALKEAVDSKFGTRVAGMVLNLAKGGSGISQAGRQQGAPEIHQGGVGMQANK